MDYRSVIGMPNDIFVAHFKKQAQTGTASVHDVKGNTTPGGMYTKRGMVVVNESKTSNAKTTPIQAVEPTDQVASQAKSDMKYGINDPAEAISSQSAKISKKGKASRKDIKTRTKKVKDILS